MKFLKTSWCISLVIATTSTMFAQSLTREQTIQQRNLEIQATKQLDKSGSVGLSGGGSAKGDGVGINASDSGMQRPIFLRTGSLSFFGGIDNSINRSANPLQLETDLEIKEGGGHDFTWSKTFSAGALTNPIDINVAMLTIVAGGGWTDTDHLIEDFEALNSQSTSAYLLFMIQHETGWSYRLGSSYAMVKDPTTKAENYMEFYPNIGATKTFDLPFDTVGIFDISGGKHLSDTDALDSTDQDRKTQDNWDFAVSLGLKYQLYNIMLSPNYRYSKKIYSTDNSSVSGLATKDRIDHTNTLSISADYPLFENINLGANYSFEQRDSNKATKYKAWNAGANVGLSLNF
jgi:hypothetical protein